MTKRTLVLRTERLAELTPEELSGAVAAARPATETCIVMSDCTTTITATPTIPDVNRCPTLFC